MSVTVEELTKAKDGKKIVILSLIQPDDTLVEVECKIEAASAAGVAYKAKGKSSLDLIGDLNLIEEMTYAPEKPKPISQKKVKPLEDGQARAHLADKHGISLKWCKDATEEQASEFHTTIDHADLGHKHVAEADKPTERDEASVR